MSAVSSQPAPAAASTKAPKKVTDDSTKPPKVKKPITAEKKAKLKAKAKKHVTANKSAARKKNRFKSLRKKTFKNVPETTLFKRKLALKNRTFKLEENKKKKQKKHLIGKLAFKRAERYMNEYLSQEKNLKILKEEAKKKGQVYIPPEPKLAFVIRIRGILGVSPKPRKILQLFRLRQINNGVFIRLNTSTRKMLTLIEPYVAWGYPDLSSVRKLLYARGFVKRHMQRIPLQDNSLVEEQLGKYGLVCVEDLVNQIFSVGRLFSKVNKFLWNFKLHAPRGGWRKIRNHYSEGGDAGNREDLINKLITRMI